MSVWADRGCQVTLLCLSHLPMCSHEWKFRTHACNKKGSEEAGLSGLGWVGLVDHQVHCRQMVEGRYGVLFIIVLHLQETPIVHCMYSIMCIAVYTVLDGHVCLVYSTGGSTHKFHFHLCTYVYMQLVSHISHWVTAWAPPPCVYVSTCFHLRYGASLVVLSGYCCCMYYRQQLFPPPPPPPLPPAS